MTKISAIYKTFQDVRDGFFPDTPLSYDRNFRPGLTYDKVVAHIPARANSERIIHKNVRRLQGLPLIAYSILMARAMGADRVILNTNDEEFCRIGERYGAECPFLRPPELSQRETPPGLASYYAARKLIEEGYPVGYWIDMYPTSPFRALSTLRCLMEILRKSGTCISINKMPTPAIQVYKKEKGNTPLTLQYSRHLFFYKPLGLFIGQHLNSKKRYCRHYEAIVDPIEQIDIDTERDWRLAEYILENKCFDFGVPMP